LPSTFSNSGIDYADAALLISTWASQGLPTDNASTVCRGCHPIPEDQPADVSLLQTRLKIDITNPFAAPLHLYIHLDGVVGIPLELRTRYQGETDWPAQIQVGGIDYKMITRGYWARDHYWCKVVRSVGGIMGVWHFDERLNGGIAQLLGTDISSIAGCSPHTSWLIYSRMPIDDEIQQIEKALRGLMKTFPNDHSTIPFSMPTGSFPFGGGLPYDDEDGFSETEDKQDQFDQLSSLTVSRKRKSKSQDAKVVPKRKAVKGNQISTFIPS
jgi:hypothetical protein